MSRDLPEPRDGPHRARTGPGRGGDAPATDRDAPERVLSVLDGTVLVAGVMLGVGIFRSPPVVARLAADPLLYLALWVAGGAIALLGALTYAELATAHPDAGGEYALVTRAYGRVPGFLVAWSRMTVIQTGSLALLGFVFGDYLADLLGLGPAGPPALAASVVVALTAVNLAGLRQGRRTQYLLTAGAVAAMAAVVAAGFLVAAGAGETGAAAGTDPSGSAAMPHAPAAAAEGASTGAAGAATVEPGATRGDADPSPGLALVFVLLAFGGWSEGAYLSAELRDRRRGIARTLLLATGGVTLLYLAVNAAYLAGLGLEGVAGSEAVAARLLRNVTGSAGAGAVGAAVLLAALSSANATVVTGARSTYALGRDWVGLGWLGRWRGDRRAPVPALLLQGGVALVLVAFGAVRRGGFEAMVAYTAPVYWLVLLATGGAAILLRRREPDATRPFRVPLHPLPPLLFCAAAAWMVWSAVREAGEGALLGLAVLGAGLPVAWWSGRRRVGAQAGGAQVVGRGQAGGGTGGRGAGGGAGAGGCGRGPGSLEGPGGAPAAPASEGEELSSG